MVQSAIFTNKIKSRLCVTYSEFIRFIPKDNTEKKQENIIEVWAGRRVGNTWQEELIMALNVT